MSRRFEKPFRVVVLGGGTAGWMAANLIAAKWRSKNVSVCVLESPDIGIIGVGEGSTPQLKFFFDTLGVSESEWMPRCNATYKNGISFYGWSDKPGFERYFHPFPSQIDDHTAPGFYFNSMARRRGADVWGHPDRFFLNSHLAGKKLGPLPAHNFPFRVSYGYHFDAHLVGAFLREHAVARGVAHLEGKVRKVVLDESGDVAHLLCEDGREIDADFFIDSSGFRSMILQEALGVPFISFSENLFNDSAVVMPTPADPAGVNCQTISTAMKHGWAWDIPLTNRTGNGYVYSSAFCSPDEAETELRKKLGLLDSDVSARHLKMKVGRVNGPWAKNCLAVGLSQGFIEPLEATALHIVQETVERFMEAFEARGFSNAHQVSFNREIDARVEGVRDYIACHYKASHRGDTEYWRANASNLALSDSLQRLLSCWLKGGDLVCEVHEQDIGKYYAPASWHCLLAGYGVYPQPQSLAPPDDSVRRANMPALDDFISRCAMNFRPHSELLALLGAPPETRPTEGPTA